ncbi:MAG: M20/M25/M40 family metallo-hydrolase [Gemmatimonadota bacterium]|nr:M20/M25/M40 family metallo-hydrolase [Gemmatimonadota bacterium]
MRINSVNPGLSPDGPGERDIAAFTATTLERLGLTVTRHEPVPGRVSVTGRLRGTGMGRSLMLNAHVDTVGVEGMADPFSGMIRDGRLYGRGAYDMKGALAACIGAVKALIDDGVRLAGDLIVAAVADEEDASIGTMDLAGKIHVDGAIVTEPTALDLCVAHKGFVWIELVVEGRAAHGSRPELGVDANVRMARVLARVGDLIDELADRASHRLVGPPSLHIATVSGGTGLSTYASRCVAGLERRTIPGETEEQVLHEIDGVLEAARHADPSLLVARRHLLTRDPFEVAVTSPLARAVSASIEGVLHHPPDVVGDTPWMDSAILAAHGVDTVVCGPDGAGAHAVEEWVDLDSVARLAEVLADAARRYCGEGD